MKTFREVLYSEEEIANLPNPRKSLLDLKVELASKGLENCWFCERKCGANRKAGKKGFCQAGTDWKIFGAHLHYGEEQELVPSGTIFQSGCNMRCVYCQNAPHSVTPELGEVCTEEKIAEWIDRAYEEGCKNVNFVTPDCYLWNILKALRLVKANIPVVWNTNAYYSEKAAELIKGIVDVYLLDFRYFSDKCAVRLSSAPNYPEVAKRNHLIANKDAEILVRLLLMPNHLDCDAKPVLRWIKENLDPDTRLNILPQYRPCWLSSKFKEIDRPLRLEEYEQMVAYAKNLGLKNLERI